MVAHAHVEVFRKYAFTGLAALSMFAIAGSATAQNPEIPAFKSVDSMEARVQGCVTCHGQSGQGTSNQYFPRIAGKPAAYLYNQLVAFRDGKRVYPPMNYLVAYLPDAYLREIAEHFAKQRPAFEAKQPSDRACDGDLARRDAGRHRATRASNCRPASRCHGVGPHRHGARHPGARRLALFLHRRATHALAHRQPAGAQPDCMKRIADRLSEADVHAVATWLAAQDPPARRFSREGQPARHADVLRQPDVGHAAP